MTPEQTEVIYLRQLLDEERCKCTVLTTILFERLGILPTETSIQISDNKQVLSKGRKSWKSIQEKLELKHRIDRQTIVSSKSDDEYYKNQDLENTDAVAPKEAEINAGG